MRGVTLYTEAGDTVRVFQPALPMRGVTYDLKAGFVYVSSFQPALPMRGVTVHPIDDRFVVRISTRTPHAGSDITCRSSTGPSMYFNPHSPCGE